MAYIPKHCVRAKDLEGILSVSWGHLEFLKVTKVLLRVEQEKCEIPNSVK
jgi:hypothetical protein